MASRQRHEDEKKRGTEERQARLEGKYYERAKKKINFK